MKLDLDLKEIKARCEAATDERVAVDDYMPNQDTEVIVWTQTDSFRAMHCSLRKDWICVKGGVRVCGITHWQYPSRITPDARARADLPDCIAEIERLQKALRDLYNDCRNEPADKQRGIVMDQAFEALEGN